MLQFGNRLFPSIIFIAFVFSINSPIFGQDKDWKTESSKDGKIEVRYHVGKHLDKTGEEVQLIEYTASTQTDVPLQKCVKAMRDVSVHKDFMGDTRESKELETYSDKEWLAYYFFEPPWPMPDNDCIMKTSIAESEDGKTIIFKGVSSPELIPKKDVKRLEYYEYEYSFEENMDYTVTFSISVILTPVSSGPAWMVKTWFPKGPIEFMEKFIKVAKELK